MTSQTNWLDVIDYFKSEHFEDLINQLNTKAKAGKIILPNRKLMFRAFQETTFNEVKVVILGQDPYPNPRHACGLAFCVPPETSPLPPSLLNIHKELYTDVGISNANLSLWPQQGVFLLNTSLSVEQGNPNSHATLGWNKLTTEVIRKLSDLRENLVFILWGRHAQQYLQLIDSNKHCIIKSVHPSPLSAYGGFFGSKPFSKTNNFLISKEIDPIQW